MPRPSRTTRRALLAAAGASALAGCADLLAGDADGNPSDDAPASPTATPTLEEGWPQVGRNAAHAGYASGIDVGSEPAVAWERSLDGSLTTPTVAGDTVYVTRGVPGDGEPRATLEAYALSSGDRRWQHPLGTSFVYTAPFSNHRPVLGDGTVYVAAGDAVVAVDAETGESAWETPVDGVITDPPTVTDDGPYAVVTPRDRDEAYTVVALDGEGSEHWRLDVDALAKPRLVAVAGDVAYVPGGEKLRAVDAASGEVRWTYTSEAGVDSDYAVVGDGSIVRGAFQEVEVVSTDGTLDWQESSISGGSGLRPAVGEGAVFHADTGGTVSAHDLASGERLWQVTPGNGEWDQETSPVLVDGTLLVPQSDGEEVRVHALDAGAGDRQWTVSGPAARIRGPVTVPGYLVAATQNRHVNARPKPNATAEPPETRGSLRAFEL